MSAKAVELSDSYSQSDLARAVNVTPQTVQQWITGHTSPRRHRIEVIARELHCDPIWLEFGGEITQPDMGLGAARTIRNRTTGGNIRRDESSARTVTVRYYPDIRASAGSGCAPIDEANILVLNVARELLKRHDVEPEHASIIQVDGDSMRGTLDHGDMILVNTNDCDPRQSRLYVISLEGDLMVKRVQRIPHGIKLLSDNTLYEPITVMATDQDIPVEIIGRVVVSWAFHDWLA